MSGCLISRNVVRILLYLENCRRAKRQIWNSNNFEYLCLLLVFTSSLPFRPSSTAEEAPCHSCCLRSNPISIRRSHAMTIWFHFPLRACPLHIESSSTPSTREPDCLRFVSVTLCHLILMSSSVLDFHLEHRWESLRAFHIWFCTTRLSRRVACESIPVTKLPFRLQQDVQPFFT